MLLGFKKRFVDPILIGTKVHTLRNKRKKTPKVGETLHMYTGLRTKNCQKITSKEKLISKQKAWIRIVFMPYKKGFELFELKICVDGKLLAVLWKYGEDINFTNPGMLDKFVKFDGFNDYQDFCDFWIADLRPSINKGGYINNLCKHVVSMDLYHWTDLRY